MIINDCVLDLENSMDLVPDAATWYDQSRYKNHGTITAGDGGWVQLPSGLWVYEFDNTATEITTTFNQATPAYSVEAWIYPTTLGGDDRIAFELFYGGLYVAAGVLQAQIYDGAYRNLAQGVIVVNTWQYTVMTYTGATLSSFINGISTGASGAWAALAPATNYWRFGNYEGGTSWLGGYMGYIKLHSYALTPGQIRNRYEKTRHLFEAS